MRMKKIVAINGSPKVDGTCSTVLNALIGKIDKPANQITRFDLNKLNIHGCQECFYCRNNKTDRCQLNDGISDALEQTKTADVIIVTSPVFYADISAQLKCFIDRTWSYFGITGVSANHLPRKRTLVFILSYGYNNPEIYDSLFEKYKYYFAMFGFDECFLIKAYGAQYHTPQIINNAEVANAIDSVVLKLNRN